MFGYVLVKKSTLCLAATAVGGWAAYHFYKHHRPEIKDKFETMKGEVSDVVEKGKQKAKDVADDVKN